jgi:hypothetical protein
VKESIRGGGNQVPQTINGIGTSICPARGFVRWGGASDHDAVECFVFVYIPLIPYKAVHTFDWNGMHYRQVPIRWSWSLVARAFFRRWLFLAGVFAAMIAGFGWMEFSEPAAGRATAMPYFVAAGILVALWGIGFWVLEATDKRSRDIRRVLGRHSLGSSDPATWANDLLTGVVNSRQLHGTDTFAAAVPNLMKARAYSQAMWAARLSTVLEDRFEGEHLTEMILADLDVQSALEVVRKDPQSWSRLMQPAPVTS